MKKIVAALIIGCIFTTAAYAYSEKVQKSIAHSLVRLHIVANSDSVEDQQLKLKVRDRLLSESSRLFEECGSPEETKAKALENLEFLRGIVKDEIEKQGYNYDAHIAFGETYFPTKYYENVALPAGKYDALCVVIGEGQGKNWWCVMFPPLCFVEGSVGNMPEGSSEKLKASLSPENYELVANQNGKLRVKAKFKIVEMFQSIHKSMIAKNK